LVTAIALAFATTGCGFAVPITSQHRSVQKAPASEDDSDAARRATVMLTAAHDLACPNVEIVLMLERRYANTAAPRYVMEGCGKRALYAETCEDYPHCRYLMLSTTPVPTE